MFAASKTASVSGGYQISRSLRFNSADSAYLNRTPASAGNRRTFTFSGWVKRSALGTDQDLFGVRIDGDNQFRFYFNTSNKVDIYNQTVGSLNARLITTQVFRDVSAWYHFVMTIDTTNATASDRMRLYVNGVEITAFDTDTQPSQNLDTQVNTVNAHTIGYFGVATGNGYMTEVNFIDGQALTPSSFGETNAQTGVWQPKAYSGSYGTNGFYLNFSDNSNTTAATLGKDYSGNGNNWTPNNFSVTAGTGNDSLVDSPTSYGTTDTGVGGEIRGNYCTWNPVLQADFWATPVGKQTLTNGNLDASGNGQAAFTTFEIPNNLKVYYEITWSSIGSEAAVLISAASRDTFELSYLSNGQKELTGNTRSSYGASWTNGDIIGVAIDRANNTATFYKNGTSQGAITHTFTTATVLGGIYGGSSSVNFGQRPFAYTAPSGFKALCTQNLPTPTIGATTATQAGKFFNPVLYTGNGTTQSVTGVGFQPDWTWIKQRSGTEWHGLFDAVRGTLKPLFSNSTQAEGSGSGVSAFNSDGVTLTGAAYTNGSGSTYVAWNWKANGSGSTNTAGSITSTVSANTTSGFSVVNWTGSTSSSAQTVGHGLGATPQMVILKNRSISDNWIVYHSSATSNSQYLLFNTTAAVATSSGLWGAGMTSSVVGIQPNLVALSTSNNVIMYCFAEVAGYSKFGSYTGNGSTDGTFVYTGFRPAYLLIKRTTSAYDWWILDSARGTINAVKGRLYANDSGAESTTYPYVDFLANGFKLRDADGGNNASGEPYIYACFASAPFKYALAR